jgi:uncharacterized protein (DUF1810 family)
VAHDLDRFMAAQEPAYEAAIGELRRGRKTGHWMWFIFPQLSGLGRSETSRYYAIASIDEARAYLEHPVLGARLRECVNALLGLPAARSAEDTFGSVDAVKLRSSMTLFARAAPKDPLFARALERFFRGDPDGATDALLASSANRPRRSSKAAG